MPSRLWRGGAAQLGAHDGRSGWALVCAADALPHHGRGWYVVSSTFQLFRRERSAPTLTLSVSGEDMTGGELCENALPARGLRTHVLVTDEYELSLGLEVVGGLRTVA